MIINHIHKTIFIHIPKCGGSSIHDALLKQIYVSIPELTQPMKEIYKDWPGLRPAKEGGSHLDLTPAQIDRLVFIFGGKLIPEKYALVTRDNPRFSNHNYTWEAHGGSMQHSSVIQVQQLFEDMGWNFNDYNTFSIVRNPYSRTVSQFLYSLLWDVPTSTWNVEKFNTLCEKPRFWWLKQFFKFTEDYGVQSQFLSWLSVNRQQAVKHIFKLENLTKDWPSICETLKLPYVDLGEKLNVTPKPFAHYSFAFTENHRKLLHERLLWCDEEKFNYRYNYFDPSEVDKSK